MAPVTLDTGNTIEAALADIVTMFRAKNADYARTGTRWSNFDDMARFLDRPSWVAALTLCQLKLSRISALGDREPRNESTGDSLLDLATYAVIALAIYREHPRMTPGGMSDLTVTDDPEYRAMLDGIAFGAERSWDYALDAASGALEDTCAKYGIAAGAPFVAELRRSIDALREGEK